MNSYEASRFSRLTNAAAAPEEGPEVDRVVRVIRQAENDGGPAMLLPAQAWLVQATLSRKRRRKL